MNTDFQTDKNPLIDEEIANFCAFRNFSPNRLGGIEIKKINLTSAQAGAIGAKKGRYVTLNVKNPAKNILKLGKECLRELIDQNRTKEGKILVVGIGNPYMTTDCLGPTVIKMLTQNRKENLLLFTPYLEGLTGISSFCIIKNLIKETSPSLIIAVDALTARNPSRICTSYQFSDAGITPGSALGKSQALSKSTLKVPVIAIGVPTVVNCRNLGERIIPSLPDMLVCPKNIDELVHFCAKNIADVINASVN